MNSKDKKLFGTDGIRGVANTYPMLPELVLKVGKALSFILKKKTKKKNRPRVILGKDTRLSGYLFEQALTAGIVSMGGNVMLVGPLPTPAIAFLTISMRADAGIMVSASHNPYYDNGIKLFNYDGYKLSDEMENEIEKLVLESELTGNPTDIGKATRVMDAGGRYIVFVKNTFPINLSLNELKVVLDCANGAAYKVGPTVLYELGADVIPIGINPDGININVNCGNLNPEILRENVLKTGADIGIALDGDGDRVILCDEKGNEIDGDKILAICAQEMKERGILKGNAVVSTEMSNMALENFLKDRGIKLYRTPVGDRHVVQKMREIGSNLGGEKSGHIILLDHTTTGDGLLASLQILSVMIKQDKPLSEISKILDLYPQTLRSIDVEERPPLPKIEGLNDLIKSAYSTLRNNGRINIRYSGTEPKIRIMVEGKDPSVVENIADTLVNFLKEKIGKKKCQN